ncbi:MAG: endonuclease/exonuclease/phosphatase family protein [Bacteroidetes bacterium]|nr:endonuclease/exonuclease/phosphatase family protein [Bacteroidota bacterium]
MSFNIRYANPGDGVDVWANRRDWVAALIDTSGADVIGLQEVLHGQLEDILAQTDRFLWEGVGRDDGRQAGEYSPILFDRRRFEQLDGGTRWLSPAPDSIGSQGWDAALPRIATWVTLRDRTSEQRITVWNTHFDHLGEQARLESARLIRAWMAEADVALGDFNALPESDPWMALVEGGLQDAGRMAGWDSVGTFRSFDPEAGISNRIDYIWLAPGHELTSYDVLDPIRIARYPSDHLPVRVSVRLAPQDQ